MLKISFADPDATRPNVLEQLKTRKLYSTYRVIDIGGAYGKGWSNEVTDLYVDLNAPVENERNIKIDICDYKNWSKVERVVEQYGKFDYAICTHTLEDLYNPFVVLDFLPKIAKAGIITMPSLQTELCRLEHPKWLGYIHHRWIFDKQDDAMLVIPKMPFLESMISNVNYRREMFEIVYEWSDEIPYKIFMNNFLGPNADTVHNTYAEFLIKTLK